MDREIIRIDSITDYCKYCGFEVLHPLVTVVDMAEAVRNYPDGKLNFGLYAVWLKQGTGCSIRYGRRSYDYQEGTVVSFAPGQVIQVQANDGVSGTGIGLLFHPDLIHGTSLGRKIGRYSFFSYDDAEALHLSERERAQYLSIIGSIKGELEHAIDKHSRELLCDHIELLLDLCLRFYDRQFITREKANGDVLADFERLLNTYFAGGMAERKGFPTVSWLAERVHLSAGTAFEKMTGVKPEPGKSTVVGNKELLIVPGAVHTDLYDDRAGVIPYDKMESFFMTNLK